MKREQCNTCSGTGKVFDWFGVLFDPSSWIPFTYPENAYKRCPACGGSGVVYREWRSYSPRFRRRG